MKQIWGTVLSLWLILGLAQAQEDESATRLWGAENYFVEVFLEEIIEEMGNGRLNQMVGEEIAAGEHRVSKRNHQLKKSGEAHIFILRLTTRLMVYRELDNIIENARLTNQEILQFMIELGSFSNGFKNLSAHIDAGMPPEERFNMPAMIKDEIRSTLNLINEFAKLGLPHFTIMQEPVTQYYRERVQQDRIEIGNTDAPSKARIHFVIGKLKSL